MGYGIPMDVEQVLLDLQPLLLEGCSVFEACAQFEHIPYSTLQSHITKSPEVQSRIEGWRSAPQTKARKILNKCINDGDGDGKLALELLRNKLPDEFNTKQKVDSKSEITGDITIETAFPGYTDGRKIVTNDES